MSKTRNTGSENAYGNLGLMVKTVCKSNENWPRIANKIFSILELLFERPTWSQSQVYLATCVQDLLLSHLESPATMA